MAAVRVGSQPLADGQAVMDLPPVVGRSVRGIDPKRLDGVDRLQHLLDLRPTGKVKQAFSARSHVGHGRVARAGSHGAQDVDARDDGAVVVGSPADKRKDAAWRERDEAPLAVEDVLLCGATEADPVLDALLDPHELDMSEVAHAVPPALSGNSRDRRSRSISATVIPRWNAAT